MSCQVLFYVEGLFLLNILEVPHIRTSLDVLRVDQHADVRLLDEDLPRGRQLLKGLEYFEERHSMA